VKSALVSVSSYDSLSLAWEARKSRLLSSCFGADRVSGKNYQKTLKSNLRELSQRLNSDFQPDGLLAFPKPKDGGGFRIICVPTIRDRIVQESLLQQLRPRFKASKIDNEVSYGLASGKSRSLIGARNFACAARNEHQWVYKTDIHKFFDNVDRTILKSAARTVVRQLTIRPLLEVYLECEITDGIESGWKAAVANAGIKPGLGVRQGMPLSPFFAGCYLRPLDQWLKKQGHPSARYVDDIVAFFQSEPEARQFHLKLKKVMSDLGLQIGEIDDPDSKTSLFSPSKPADFLGMQITPSNDGYKLFVSEKTITAVQKKISDLATIKNLIEKKQSLTTFGSYFESVERGYLNAYDTAHNAPFFNAAVSGYLSDAKQVVLLELFGPRFDDLTDLEKRFAGID
jgi:RNA-directed DNA polymerase